MQLFDADNNYISDPNGGYQAASKAFKAEINAQIEAENELDQTKFSDSDNEYYSQLKKDLNTCYTIEWASTTKKVLNTNSAGEPINKDNSPYSTGTTPITSSEYTYTTVNIPSNGTSEISFNTVYRSALLDLSLDLYE